MNPKNRSCCRSLGIGTKLSFTCTSTIPTDFISHISTIYMHSVLSCCPCHPFRLLWPKFTIKRIPTAFTKATWNLKYVLHYILSRSIFTQFSTTGNLFCWISRSWFFTKQMLLGFSEIEHIKLLLMIPSVTTKCLAHNTWLSADLLIVPWGK